jgi:hypothetical protein
MNEFKRRGKAVGTVRDEPYYPDRAREAVRMRKMGLTFAEIGDVLNITRVGARYLYMRWKGWYEEERKVSG